MWSRDENVGQSDTGQASVPVDELGSQEGREGAQHGLAKSQLRPSRDAENHLSRTQSLDRLVRLFFCTFKCGYSFLFNIHNNRLLMNFRINFLGNHFGLWGKKKSTDLT